MEKQFLETIKKYNMIQKGDTIILGFSGGCDSLSLFILLHKYKEQLGINIEAVHINHMLFEKSIPDEEFCIDICNRYNTKIHTYRYNVYDIAREKKLSVEEAGRNLRYEIFESHCIDNTYKVAIAHNKNDVAETFLMRLFRGAGVQGLKSITPARQNIIRPIIEIERSQLHSFLTNLEQEYLIDPTNLLPVYTRNKIRLDILPKIQEVFNPNVVSTIYNTTKILEEEQDFIQSILLDKYDSIVSVENNKTLIDISKLKEEHLYLQKQILFKVISTFIPNNKNINKNHINNLINIINSNDGNKTLSFPSDIIVSKNYNILSFGFKKEATTLEPLDLSLDKLTYLPTIKKYIYATTYENSDLFYDKYNVNKNFIISELENTPTDIKLNIEKLQVFCYDSVYDCLHLKIRSRENGDKIHIKNLGTKKLKDYFIDKKIPKELRNLIPIVTLEDDSILWILDDFYTPNDYYTQYKKQQKIIVMFIMEENNGKW